MDLIDRKALLEKTKKLESYLVVCKDFFSREDLIKIVNLYCERWRNIINQEPNYEETRREEMATWWFEQNHYL